MVDAELRYCRCGHEFKFNWLQRLYIFIKGSIDYQCPHCGIFTNYRMIYHIVADNTVRYSENNVIQDNKRKVFRNG